jgi:DNA-binding CsgD family transcriptional regulator
MKAAMLIGVARSIPDVNTFSVPVFSNGKGGYFIQRAGQKKIECFDDVNLGSEFVPLSATIWASSGDESIHCFEISEGEFVFGSAGRLAEFLVANENQWRERRETARAVERFISTATHSPAFHVESRAPLARAFYVEPDDGAEQDMVRADLVAWSPRAAPATVASLALHGDRGRDHYSAVLNARTREDFRLSAGRFARQLGFETVSQLAVVDVGVGSGEFLAFDDRPTGFVETYSHRWIKRLDPVMQHCKLKSVPIVWNQNTYVEQSVGDLWEQQAQLGYRTGIAMALHLPEGKHFLLGVDRDQALPSNAAELHRLVADLQLFAVYAQDAAMRLLVPPALQPQRPALTPRELEALRWTMDGKTAWEVGSRLGISERTAMLHVNNATHKLGCVNKHQAVLKALRLGLIA